jgi:predicted ATPase
MQVKIQNYQSLKDVEFEVRGLTVITGANNTGKSACARAVSGVFSNTRGNSHVRIGEKNSTVSVTFDDSNKVEWRKGKGVNSYEVNGELIDKVGSSVPDEVKSLGVVSVDVSGKEVWPQVSKQFEQVFLLDLPPSTLSSALSDVDQIQKLEKASALARSDIKSIKAKIKFKNEDLQSERVALESFEGIDDVEAILQSVESLQDSLNKLEKECSSLEKVQAYREGYASQISTLKDALDVVIPDYDLSCLDRAEELSLQNKERNRLSVRIMVIGVGLESFPKIPEAEEIPNYEQYQRVVDKRESLKRTIQEIEPLLDLELPEIKEDQDTLRDLNKRHRLNQDCLALEKEIQELQSEVSELQSSLTGVCPLCEQELSTH